MNYHSRTPLISGIASDFRGVGARPAMSGSIFGLSGCECREISTKKMSTNSDAFSKGFMEYPEDIKLYGFSFNTTLEGTSVAGELAYRQDEPLQIDDVEILYAGMPEQLANAEFTLRLNLLEGISQIGRYYGNKVGPGRICSGLYFVGHHAGSSNSDSLVWPNVDS